MKNCPRVECKRVSISMGAIYKAAYGTLSRRGRWRFSVTKSVRLHGEAGEVDLVAAEQNMQKLRLELNGYHPSNIFNMDEAGLFF